MLHLRSDSIFLPRRDYYNSGMLRSKKHDGPRIHKEEVYSPAFPCIRYLSAVCLKDDKKRFETRIHERLVFEVSYPQANSTLSFISIRREVKEPPILLWGITGR